MTVAALIYRHRLIGKRAVAWLSRQLPASASRRVRALAERVAFNLTPQYQGDTLPAIFHYWSGRYLAPQAQRLGIDSPEAFYLDRIRAAQRHSMPLRVLSLGSGAASMEIYLAEQLRAAGVAAQIICMDFNPTLMRNAAASAKARGLDPWITFETCDCNRPFERPAQDVIIVNQFFHHVTELETFCRSLRNSLAPDGVLLSSDIIGRNGHQLWPDVEIEVQRIWASLPPEQQFDRHFGARQAKYPSIDHAAYSNEGVRAQDIVGCLLEEFDFELFFSFGAAIVPFIERRIGFNFAPDVERDRALIDHVQAIDAEALTQGRYPTTSMIAALRHKNSVTDPIHLPISPQRHVELTQQQLRKVASTTR
ncbi:class I SAM-dependent methyltransferase [Dyella tabacisoli]|uniref:Class I SAM-dependent methyltransferase n=1 Tax=Dyella tabacisoli TaxID=2282381 RepID=A0A369UIE9_9GAMM|nr:class I SAM-dependent methyltransferase [Dyella tabacisoli]RDD79885.1 class I SAM-dependent methyltransferase [Dyella tabacisoli]